ncbi:hypothetical protein HID58_047649 [Brassica napus]|uniref:Uncharacterized protein n=1 Tax=Brassica napus TaxID=3708 RepID=A0ABQ8AZT6_BRANA|nr:hypothetical protein HID58_047649 [Brassica napus]
MSQAIPPFQIPLFSTLYKPSESLLFAKFTKPIKAHQAMATKSANPTVASLRFDSNIKDNSLLSLRQGTVLQANQEQDVDVRESKNVVLWERLQDFLSQLIFGSSAVFFAEILTGRPLLKRKNRVGVLPLSLSIHMALASGRHGARRHSTTSSPGIEQLHIIYKLFGSPDEEFWEITSFILKLRCLDHNINMSVYFNTKPYACDTSTLPKFPPNSEMDAKYRGELQRGFQSIFIRSETEKLCRTIKELTNLNKLPTQQEAETEIIFHTLSETSQADYLKRVSVHRFISNHDAGKRIHIGWDKEEKR